MTRRFKIDEYDGELKKSNMKLTLSAELNLAQIQDLLSDALLVDTGMEVDKLLWQTKIIYGGSQRDPEETVQITGLKVIFKSQK